MSEVSIWTGDEFLMVSEKEAEELVKNDKAQYTHLDFSHLKHRHEFTGYVTREMRADRPIAAAPVVEIKPEPKKEAKSWRQYRKEVGQAIGKPATKVTKKEVEEYLNGDI